MSTPYRPNPEAAKYAARLIQHNHKESLPSDLPIEWVYITDAIDQVAARGRRARYAAFVEATRDFHFEMVEEVNAVLETVEDPEEKSRIYYRADDAYTDPPQTEWCVEGVFARPSLNLLVGPPGSLKTWAALDLAVAVAAGLSWLGRAVTQAPTIFVDEETGLSRLWGRIHAVLHGRSAGYGLPLHFVSFGGYDLRQPQDIQHLIQRALTFEAQLIVIDTLAGVLRGGDENSVLSVQPLLYNLRRLAEHCRAAVLLIHHTNRSGSFRGSSSISAGVDLMLGVQSPEEARIDFETLKARHAAPSAFAAQVHFEQDVATPLRVHLTAAEHRPHLGQKPPRPGVLADILDYIEEHDSATTPQLIAWLAEYSPGTVRNAVHQLVAAGRIRRANEGLHGKTALFELVDPSMENENA
ncbi:MAG: AAA family ATPase [Anaerolineales bacterium]|nr:AAA family ATPase [Anaerolineales bacterium]MCW5856620.1 AAA family ATPase [Anaerolineales bacterium]